MVDVVLWVVLIAALVVGALWLAAAVLGFLISITHTKNRDDREDGPYAEDWY